MTITTTRRRGSGRRRRAAAAAKLVMAVGRKAEEMEKALNNIHSTISHNEHSSLGISRRNMIISSSRRH